MIKLSNTGETGLRSVFGPIPKDEVISTFLGGLQNSGSECFTVNYVGQVWPGRLPRICKLLKRFFIHRTARFCRVRLSCSCGFRGTATGGSNEAGDICIAYN
ncbi:hypothetical protein BDM02DRAFT_3115971 [Thelephora ganbajun]|uniref:Uncharacterized protein n=1 Tax=Thelephora ganbajun TaxID=370292 RepID=A0ACB6ZE77_THEGA|nr:hypothetical protein BDM02DRAFT_3115971 [Thelephora ganbajun]